MRVIPKLLKSLGTEKEAKHVVKFYPDQRLEPLFTPLHPEPATIEVINEGTLNTATQLAGFVSSEEQQQHNPRPAVLNFADSDRPGGGWRNGAMAQEETICYRSSLDWSLTANPRNYLLRGGILYSPYVLVAMGADYEKLPGPTNALLVVNVLSVAAIRKPRVARWKMQSSNPAEVREKCVFARDKERNITKLKMRLCLRVAANRAHRVLVLGALGCGVYQNPSDDIAHCWLEVLREDEFSGNRAKFASRC
ncbi:hypothetical protein DL766_004253 [Monosporascus sp. MC13-8B]|uniref:Microbial-type PARG catalytic domain-containing protein n=1 Tax=Monosporascus cannonballus TaxID=155416 RepID=A0ABY0HCU7_9PEZI|nr:hypothetical protein DL762_002671 [Monosporascus cannonballus]RYO95434.1 hypothetical protein DL763_003698 [Monosporascus cannonballus]RYP31774.1 hypothetical protein DL766_004253 [Monosporascus sp. MC13-8B]